MIYYDQKINVPLIKELVQLLDKECDNRNESVRIKVFFTDDKISLVVKNIGRKIKAVLNINKLTHRPHKVTIYHKELHSAFALDNKYNEDKTIFYSQRENAIDLLDSFNSFLFSETVHSRATLKKINYVQEPIETLYEKDVFGALIKSVSVNKNELPFLDINCSLINNTDKFFSSINSDKFHFKKRFKTIEGLQNLVLNNRIYLVMNKRRECGLYISSDFFKLFFNETLDEKHYENSR